MDYNPNDIGIPNGNYFAFPYTVEESEIVLLSVPWDATTSYGKGTASGPEAIINASTQVDLYDFDVKDAWKIKTGTIPIEKAILTKNKVFGKYSDDIISLLEKGISVEDKNVSSLLEKVNKASDEINQWVYNESLDWLNKGKIVGVIGGEHSVPYGLIKALCSKHESFGILHIDAHADLRNAYEGFTHSHASIMFNSMKFKNITKLVQVAVRDVCEDEIEFANNDDRVIMYHDFQIKQDTYKGVLWDKQCDEIMTYLPENVYISFDIDGLTPEHCPNTGTPVPGGLRFYEAVYLIKKLSDYKKRIIGFDLCEVSPGDTEWDANVGARILQKLINYTHLCNE